MTARSPAVVPFAEPAASDEAAVRRTIDDYFLGWFDGDPGRMARALQPDLAKRGWVTTRGRAPAIAPTTAARMVELTDRGEGRRAGADERRFEVRIVEVHEDIATAIVHSVPYIEYLHLVRTAAGWRIVNALWRAP